MKKYRLTMMTGLTALAIASTASAATNIVRITGATAYRAAASTAILGMLAPGRVYGYTGASFTGAGSQEFRGALLSDTNILVDIKTSWNGSVDGIQRLVNAGNAAYNITNYINAPAGSLTAGGASGLPAGTENAAADIAFSDAYQNSTIYQNPALTDNIIGVIPFLWVRNNGSPVSMSNMQPILAQQLLSFGSVPLEFFTGNSNDTTRVRVVGRNADSGTRVGAFAESGFGVGSAPAQQAVTVSNGAVTACSAYPAETILGVSYGIGQSGYASGGTVASSLAASNSNAGTVTGNKGWLVGYVGVSDAITATNGGGVFMTYNGVTYSQEGVRNGQYTFWSHEHMLWGDDVNGDATKLSIAEAIRDGTLAADPGSAAVKLDTMHVTKGQEGGPISPQ